MSEDKDERYTIKVPNSKFWIILALALAPIGAIFYCGILAYLVFWITKSEDAAWSLGIVSFIAFHIFSIPTLVARLSDGTWWWNQTKDK